MFDSPPDYDYADYLAETEEDMTEPAQHALVEILHEIAPTTALERLTHAADRLEEYIASKFSPASSTDVEDPTGSGAPEAGAGDGTSPDGDVAGLG